MAVPLPPIQRFPFVEPKNGILTKVGLDTLQFLWDTVANPITPPIETTTINADSIRTGALYVVEGVIFEAPLSIASGGTSAASSVNARTNLGLAIGFDVQGYNIALESIADLTTAADEMIYLTGANVYATTGLTSVARTLIEQVTQANMRAIGLGLGSLAVQDDNAVSLTGGTIDGIAIGGTVPDIVTGTTVTATTDFLVGLDQVVGARQTGWVAMTGTPDISTVYDTSTVTLSELAGRVMAIQEALITHGLIGT